MRTTYLSFFFFFFFLVCSSSISCLTWLNLLFRSWDSSLWRFFSSFWHTCYSDANHWDTFVWLGCITIRHVFSSIRVVHWNSRQEWCKFGNGIDLKKYNYQEWFVKSSCKNVRKLKCQQWTTKCQTKMNGRKLI
jgi:hypothetical protein